MLAPALACLAIVAASATDPVVYLMSYGGTPVGTVQLRLDREAGRFVYQSETYVRRGSTLTRNHSQARLALSSKGVVESLAAETFEGEALVRTVKATRRGEALAVSIAEASHKMVETEVKGAMASSLVFASFGQEPSCFPVLDETSGETGEACGVRAGDEVRGTLLSHPFVAQMSGQVLQRLELPDQRTAFALTSNRPTAFAPPDLLGGSVPAEGLAALSDPRELTLLLVAGRPLDLPVSANQAAQKSADGASVRWERSRIAEGRLEAARAISQRVYESIPDKRPGPYERQAARALAEGRGACVAHTEAFLAAAGRSGVLARRALGLVADEGRFWPHEWAQVQIDGAWHDVDPTEGTAPARTPRILFAAGEQADERAAAGLAETVRSLTIRLASPTNAGKDAPLAH
jgi:hypothetical protein